MFSVPDGRAANQPLRVATLSQPMAFPSPGAFVRIDSIASPASSFAVTCAGESFPRRAFSSGVAAASVRA